MKNKDYYEERFEKAIKMVDEIIYELPVDEAEYDAFEDQRTEFEDVVLELIHKYAKD